MPEPTSPLPLDTDDDVPDAATILRQRRSAVAMDGRTGLTADAFKEFVATGASDDEVAAWIEENATPRDKREIIQWNNDYRYKRLCEMPIELQEFLEGYIPENIPAGKIVNYWFDVYDIEEQRI